MHREYTLFHGPIFSFFSKRFYQEIAREWRGIGFLYLLFWNCITAMLVVGGTYGYFRHYLATDGFEIASNIPTFQIRDGLLAADCVQPYVLTNPGTDDVLAVLDTTGSTPIIEAGDGGPRFMASHDTLYVRNDRGVIQHFPLDGFGDVAMDGAQVYAIVDRWSLPVAMVAFVGMVVGSQISYMILAMIYGAVAMIMTRGVWSDMSYGSCVRLAVVAWTPSIILSAASGLFPADLIYTLSRTAVCFALPLLYLYWTVTSPAPREQAGAGGMEISGGFRAASQPTGQDAIIDTGPTSGPLSAGRGGGSALDADAA